MVRYVPTYLITPQNSLVYIIIISKSSEALDALGADA
jgi:hypothetical protein